MWKSMPNGATKKTKSARKLLLLGVAIGLIGAGVFFAIRLQNKNGTLRVNNVTISIEKAIADEQKKLGLCCRDSLDENSGMLFIYNQPGNYRFWMKDTKIPLDMYWINSDKKIIHIEANVKPETYPQSFGTDKPAQYILETNAGFAAEHNINTGDLVRF